MKPEDLQTFLEEAGFTWPMRAHELPTSPDTCIAIAGYAGIAGRMKEDSGLPRDDQPRFQILVRSKDDLEASLAASDIHDAIHVRFADVGEVRVFRMEAEQRPFLRRNLDPIRFVYSFNISAWVLRS